MASAPGTPQRRSMADLNLQLSEIFDALPSSNGTRSASLQDLPRLIASFEQRRGIELLNDEEKEQLTAFASGNPEQPVGVDDLMQILQFMTANTPRPVAPSQPTSTSSLSTQHPPPKMLTPDVSHLSDGSPAPRTRTRTTSSLSTSSLSSVSSAASTTPTSSPSKLARPTSSPSSSKRRSFLSALSFSPGSSNAPGSGEDLSRVVGAAGGMYLGVQLDGPLGAGWDPDEEVDKLRVATKGLGTREKEVVVVLADKTFPQIRSIDKTYKVKHGKSLLELVNSEKSLRGNMEYALKGLVMGPLNWDVELLRKAIEGVTKNDTLVIDLLISRPPSSLALLRLAYSHRLSTSGSPAKHKSLDAAVLAAYSGNSKMRKALEVALEGKWQDAGEEGEGMGGGETFEERVQLLKEDVDQLRVAMPRGASGNQEIVSRILLARSPAHIHSLTVEYLKTSRNSLTHAIKESFTGSVEKAFLYAVENGKKDRDGPGVWRDAKMLEKTMEGARTRNEALTWRLVRLHWDRSRFLAVQNCFKQKYKKSLVDRVHGETSGAFRDLLKTVITTATLPEPLPSPEDVDRLDSLGTRSRGSSVSSAAGSGRSVEVEDADVSDVLEGTGELSNPPSPRSPPPPIEKDEERGGDSTPLGFYFPRTISQPALASRDDAPSTPTLSSSSSTPSELGSSTSSLDGRPPSGMGHRSSSSLSFRQRSSPLEAFGHKAPSSAGGSAPRTFEKPPVSSLRHNRPVAPGRIRRTSGDLARVGSEEPTSPSASSGGRSGRNSPVMARSPTPSSDAGRAKSPTDQYATSRRGSGNKISPPLSRSVSSGSSVLGGSDDLHHGRPTPIDIPTSPPADSEGGSPPASLDTTSYHAAPISPVGDVGPSSSPPTSPSVNAYSFSDLPPLGTNLTDYFGSTASPDKSSSPGPSFLRRDNSTTSSSSGESRPGSLFYGEGVGQGGQFRPDSMAGNFGLYGRPGSTASVGGSGDQFQMLLRHAHELAKKLKEAEARLATSASSYEEDHTELEGRLEEVRAELQIKRREEKELRGAEKQHLSLIASLEGDVAKITKQLERSRESYDGMKRSYQDQCTEAEKLRTLVAETRRELRAAEEAAMTHTLQVQGFEKDRALLQVAINKLEDDLAVARQAQDSLEEQKQANLLLKETIDRLKFELDEVRSVNRKSLFDAGGSSGDQSHAGSEVGSISKSLGKELARRLAEAGVADDVESSEGEATEGEEDEVDDIIVTTHRRIKKRGSKSTAQPTVTRVEETTIVVDAHTQTEAVSTSEMHVQTDLSATTVDLVPAVEPPVVEEPTPKTAREIQEELAKELGIDWTKLNEFVEGQKAPSSVPKPLVDPAIAGVVSARRAGRHWATRLSTRIPNAAAQAPAFFINVFPDSARPFVSQILESSTSFVLYTIAVYLGGFISGSALLPLNHHHHLAPFNVLVGQSDVALWNQYNTLGRAWGEGLATSGGGGGIRDSFMFWVTELVWGGVSVVRRVPT